MYIWVYTCTPPPPVCVYVYTTFESQFSFYCVDPRDQTQIVRLWQEPLLTEPSCCTNPRAFKNHMLCLLSHSVCTKASALKGILMLSG